MKTAIYIAIGVWVGTWLTLFGMMWDQAMAIRQMMEILKSGICG
jgi:hypothetical protein